MTHINHWLRTIQQLRDSHVNSINNRAAMYAGLGQPLPDQTAEQDLIDRLTETIHELQRRHRRGNT